MVSLLVSVVLVSALLPWITAFLKENTPVYTMVEEQCRTVMEKQIGEAMFSGAEKSTGESSQADIYRNMGREEIKALMEANGYDGSLLDALSDEQLEQYKEQYIQQYFSSDTTNSGESDNSGAVLLGNLTRIEQTELIENLPLPEFLQDILLDYNNEEGYQGLGVSTFQDYLIGFIATGILNVAAFLASVLIVHLLLWLSISALSILANLPVIRVVNRVAGLAFAGNAGALACLPDPVPGIGYRDRNAADEDGGEQHLAELAVSVEFVFEDRAACVSIFWVGSGHKADIRNLLRCLSLKQDKVFWHFILTKQNRRATL